MRGAKITTEDPQKDPSTEIQKDQTVRGAKITDHCAVQWSADDSARGENEVEELEHMYSNYSFEELDHATPNDSIPGDLPDLLEASDDESEDDSDYEDSLDEAPQTLSADPPILPSPGEDTQSPLPPDDLDPSDRRLQKLDSEKSKSAIDMGIPEGPLSTKSLETAMKLEQGKAIGSLNLRPTRIAALGTKQPITEDDKKFLRQAQDLNYSVRYIPNAKKIKGKKNQSAIRYKKYQSAQTLNEALKLGSLPSDIFWDYARGFILFPQREPQVHAHYASDEATSAVFGNEQLELPKNGALVVLDLFCGTKSLQPVCQNLGWHYLSMDKEKRFKPDYLSDVMDWNYQKDLKDKVIDIVFCSPPCTLFSKLRFAHRTLKRMHKTRKQVENEMLDQGLKMLSKTKEIISWLTENCQTQVYFIENPSTGHMKKFMTEYPLFEVDYCAYQPKFGYKKPTAIWSNVSKDRFHPRLCPGFTCPATLPDSCVHRKNAFRDELSSEVLYRVPYPLLHELLIAAAETIQDSRNKIQSNYVDVSEPENSDTLPTFNSMIQTMYPPDNLPEFMHSWEAYLQFGLESFKELCMTDYLNAVECHTAFVGGSNIPENLKPEEVTLPKHDGDLSNNNHSQHWVDAMAEEMDVLEKRNCWTWQSRTEAEKNPNFKRCKPIPTIWIHKVKTNDKGFVYRFRSRLVVRGDLTIEGVHYSDVFAPVVSMDSVRTVLSLAAANPSYDVHQGDISAAFIHPKLKDDIWILPPPRHQRIGEDGKPQVLKLLRTLYGLKSSPLAWFECFTETILGFAAEFPDVKVSQLVSDSCIFIVERGEERIYTTIYVDDVLTVATTIEMREWFFQALSNHFDLQASETGECTWLLGIRVDVNRAENHISLSQEQAIQKIVRSQALSPDDTAVTPMASELRLMRLEQHDPSVNPEECMNGISFRSVLGSVLYISTSTRPDIAFPVNLIARHVTGIGPEHVKALLRVVKYLNGSQSWGIRYHCPELPVQPMQTVGYQSATHPCDPHGNHLMRCYADADYAQSENRKSTTGFTIVMNGGPICWRSSRQKIIAQSTAEAEIISATEAGKDVIHTRLLLKELGFPEQVEKATVLFEDNQSCIYLARNLKSRRTAKHFEIRLRFLQQMVLDQEIQFVYIGSSDQVADMLTKPLAETQFLNLRTQIMADCSPNESSLNAEEKTGTPCAKQHQDKPAKKKKKPS